MAEFKRAIASGSEDGGAFGFDGTTLSALGDLTGVYWPLMVGTLVLMVMVMRGDNQAVIPVGGGMMLLQAWRSGMFG